MTEHRIETHVEIAAPPAEVWHHLTDFAAMPSWNPFITALSGSLVAGGRLSVRVSPPGKSGMTFKPTVLTVAPERELRWLGRLMLPGIFDGEHYFLLEPTEIGGTRLTQGERFSGALVGIMGGMLRATEQGFTAMNAALKRRAEAS